MPSIEKQIKRRADVAKIISRVENINKIKKIKRTQ